MDMPYSPVCSVILSVVRDRGKVRKLLRQRRRRARSLMDMPYNRVKAQSNFRGKCLSLFA